MIENNEAFKAVDTAKYQEGSESSELANASKTEKTNQEQSKNEMKMSKPCELSFYKRPLLHKISYHCFWILRQLI